VPIVIVSGRRPVDDL